MPNNAEDLLKAGGTAVVTGAPLVNDCAATRIGLGHPDRAGRTKTTMEG